MRAAERVPDQDRRRGQRLDLRLVVVDDLGQPEAPDLLGVVPELRDVALFRGHSGAETA